MNRTNEQIYGEKLAWFKRTERPEAVLVIADDPGRIKLVVAWTNMEISHVEKLPELRSESDNDVWRWLWQNTKYSRLEFMEKARISMSESVLEVRMKPLIGNRVIYPDGIINSFVQRYLREQVVRLFEAKPKRSTKKG